MNIFFIEKIRDEDVSSKSSPSREVEIILNDVGCFENFYEKINSPFKLDCNSENSTSKPGK